MKLLFGCLYFQRYQVVMILIQFNLMIQYKATTFVFQAYQYWVGIYDYFFYLVIVKNINIEISAQSCLLILFCHQFLLFNNMINNIKKYFFLQKHNPNPDIVQIQERKLAFLILFKREIKIILFMLLWYHFLYFRFHSPIKLIFKSFKITYQLFLRAFLDLYVFCYCYYCW